MSTVCVTDGDLVARARDGDHAAFGELVDRHRVAVYRASMAALGSHAEAEDAAQDAFVVAWRRLDSFRGEASFKTWLLTIAWRQAINRRRTLLNWWRRTVPLDETAVRVPPRRSEGGKPDTQHTKENPMNVRAFTLAALMTLTSIGVMVAQSPAPPAAPAQTSRGRTGQSAAPRAPATPAHPAQPAPDADAPPPPPPAPPAPPSTPTPRRENQSTNVRIDVTVTDQRPGSAVLTKTVSVVTGDGLNGSVRSQTTYLPSGAGPGTAPFNVDAWPVILADGKVHVRLIVQYDVVPPPGPTNDGVRLLGTSIRDSVAMILENGKPLVAVQSSDPVSDRKVSVEVKATILR